MSLTLGAIVAALVAKAGDRAIEATVATGEGALVRLVSRLRQRFSDADDQAAARMLESMDRVPDSQTLVVELAAAVDRHVAVDSCFATELEKLVKQVRSEGVDVGCISQVVCGDGNNVQIAGVNDSQINIGRAHVPPPS